jgi:hypothetical protein
VLPEESTLNRYRASSLPDPPASDLQSCPFICSFFLEQCIDELNLLAWVFQGIDPQTLFKSRFHRLHKPATKGGSVSGRKGGAAPPGSMSKKSESQAQLLTVRLSLVTPFSTL